MHDNMPRISKSALVRFLILAYGLGFIAQWLAVRAGISSGKGGGPWLQVTMWTPALAAFASGAGPRGLALRALKRLGLRHLALGFCLGSAPALLGQAFSFAMGTGQWNRVAFELDPAGSHVTLHHVATVFGAIEPQGIPLFVLNLVLSTSLAAILGAIALGIGEEIGWRAVLQPALEQRLGFVKGTLCVGLLWAYWHLPVNLAGYNDARHPVLTALVIFPVAVVALAFILAWLFGRSGSVWPCAVAHMANNLWSSVPLVKTQEWVASNFADLAAVALVAGLLVFLQSRRRIRGRAGIALPAAANAFIR
jgi:CAAX protease family protein